MSVVPEGGIPTFSAPDPTVAPGERLPAGQHVDVLEQRSDGWALVRVDTGSTVWVDGRRLVASAAVPAPVGAPTPPPAPTAWAPTHRAAAGGMPAWDAPNPQAAPVARLEAHLEVELLEQRPDGWGRVACSNGWTCWIDARQLGPLSAPPEPSGPPSSATTLPPPPIEPRWLAAVGGGLMLLSAVVPWFTVVGFSFGAWKLPLWFLVLRTNGDTQPRVDALLIPAALLLLAYAGASLADRRLPNWTLLVGGAVGTNLGMFGILRWLHPDTGLGLGLGAPLAVVGGALAAVGFWFNLQRGIK